MSRVTRAAHTRYIWSTSVPAPFLNLSRVTRAQTQHANIWSLCPHRVLVLSRVKLHAKSVEARNAETKIRETHARIDEAGRAVRSGAVGEVGGVAGIGSAENR